MRIAALVLREIDVRGVAKPLLRQLWTEWQETCSLCLYRPATHSAMVAEIIHTPKPLRFVLEPFVELSLTWGSLGRAILAFLPEEEAALAIERGQVGPLSGLPSPSGAELAEALAQVRELGFAHYRNDAFDVAGVAAPVYRADALVIGSIGLTLPSQRLQADRIGAMARAVGDVAARLSTALGYSR
jgi:DNA-binding IclR family transcriptional regulator